MDQARIQDLLHGGGGGNNGRVQRRRGSRVDKHQIKVHSVHIYIYFFAIVKKFVEKENWWSRAGGGGVTPPPLDPCLWMLFIRFLLIWEVNCPNTIRKHKTD